MKKHWHYYEKDAGVLLFLSDPITEEEAEKRMEQRREWALSGEKTEAGMIFCSEKH